MSTTVYKINGRFKSDDVCIDDESVSVGMYLFSKYNVAYDATLGDQGILGFEITEFEEDAAFKTYDDIKSVLPKEYHIRLTEHTIEILAEDSDD